MINRKYKLFLAVSMAILVMASCGAPSAPAESPDEAPPAEQPAPTEAPAMDTGACSNPFLPVEEGKTYVYNQIEGGTTTEYTITYTDVSSSGFTQMIEEDDQSVSVEWNCTENGLVPGEFFEADFIQIEGMEFDVETTEVSGHFLPPANEWEVGNSWDLAYTVTVNVSAEGLETSVEGSMDLKNTIAAQESVTVPAGTYDNAYRVEQTGTFNASFMGMESGSSMEQTYWFVRDVGLIRNVVGIQGAEYSLELVSVE